MTDNGKTETTTIKTERKISQREWINALKNSMDPIFDHFESELSKQDGQQLDISITVQEDKIALNYGVGKIDS